MFLSRIGFRQIGLTRPCLAVKPLSKALSLDFCRGLQTLVPKPGVRRCVGGTAYAKRAFGAGVAAGIGLGVSAFARPKILCEAPAPGIGIGFTEKEELRGPISPGDYPPPPRSSLSMFELSFGAVTGICAGVFVKKGAKAVAWFLGGIFVLLQYMGSTSLVKVDWAKVSSRFENLFYHRDAGGNAKPPSVMSLWRWLVDFLTADFQPRASFIAGFALGLRVG